MDFFATTARGLERTLHAELGAIGVSRRRITSGGVAFSGSLEQAYRACLWSRTASRVLLTLVEGRVDGPDALYELVSGVDWIDHLGLDQTFAVDALCRDAAIDNSQFAAVRVKDAVADQLRERYGSRPSVNRKDPDLRVNLNLRGARATLALDLAGQALHRRGWRVGGAKAPLKENLAAALLLMAGWPGGEGAPALLDPTCGAGTFPIEAALIATDTAPGLLRCGPGGPGFALQRARSYDAPLFERLLAEARERDLRETSPSARIVGSDVDPTALTDARQNAERAGVAAWIEWRRGGIAQGGGAIEAPAESGLVMVNPPYGVRLGDDRSVEALYRELANALRGPLRGWRAAVISANERVEAHLGRAPRARHDVYNGPLACQLLEYEPVGAVEARLVDSPFANRLRKRARHFDKWAARRDVHCYRVYDADLPDYAVAIDRYEGWVQVQEYAPPKEIYADAAGRRLAEVMAAVPAILEVAPEQVILKVRRRQRGDSQYERESEDGVRVQVREGGHRFWVNLSDYLDTGLFLDHRDTRAAIERLAAGKRFLNLFAYTATATVYAAAGGAVASTSVDLSNTYLGWAARNFELNEVDRSRHRLVRADCLEWLAGAEESWDLIYLDPPTFSNSKRMARELDVQRDHVELLAATLARLAPGGVLLFSTNRRRFDLDEAGLRAAVPTVQIEDWTQKTMPQDFERDGRAHKLFALRW
jgi:23S rRNA (guanine2445-N2)-methyltransferase / 23S rRNA (guanine2069-N7)-methyltransferase